MYVTAWGRLMMAAAACAAGWAPAPAAADPDDVVARCGDLPIRRSEVEAVVRRLGLAEMPAGPRRLRAEATILEQLVDERILGLELDRIGITATEGEIDAAEARLREQVVGRGGDFEAFLARSGRTPATLRRQLALEIRLDTFVRGEITPEAITAAFERNRRELDGTRLRVSHILLRAEERGEGDPASAMLERAAEIRRGVIQGRASFAEAARAHSSGPSRRLAGDLGWIARDGPMIDAFSSQAFRLGKGAVSEPFVTPFGVHLVTVTDVEPGRVGLDAVRPRLEKLLATQLIRGLVAVGRQRTAVSFEDDVPHFDPATAGRSPDERPVIGIGPEGR